MFRCLFLFKNPDMQLQSSHGSTATCRTTKRSQSSTNVLAAFDPPTEASGSSSALVSNEVPKLPAVTQPSDNITSLHEQSITSAAILLKGSASNLSLLGIW